MTTFDRYASASGLRQIDPLLKLWFALPALILCLSVDSIAFSLLVLCIMAGVTVFGGRVPAPVFVRLMLLPLAFLLSGVAGVALEFGSGREQFMAAIPVGGWHLGVSAAGLDRAAGLLFKALGSLSCMYFISLTTSPADLMIAAQRLRVPVLFIEMAGLIYRFLFILLDTARRMHCAQDSRLGHVGPRASYRSLAALSSTLFIQAGMRADECYTALECRGYAGSMRMLHEPYARPRIFLALALLVYGVLCTGALLAVRFPEALRW